MKNKLSICDQCDIQAIIASLHELQSIRSPEPVAWKYSLVVEGQTVKEQSTHVNWNPKFQPFGRHGVEHGGEVIKTPLYASPTTGTQSPKTAEEIQIKRDAMLDAFSRLYDQLNKK